MEQNKIHAKECAKALAKARAKTVTEKRTLVKVLKHNLDILYKVDVVRMQNHWLENTDAGRAAQKAYDEWEDRAIKEGVNNAGKQPSLEPFDDGSMSWRFYRTARDTYQQKYDEYLNAKLVAIGVREEE